MIEGAWKQAAEAWQKEWEQQAARWWDATLREPPTLEGMRKALEGVCAAKERSDQALEQLWALYRLPTATDVERLHERLGDLEDGLARLQATVEALAERLPAKAKAEPKA
ncbi:MAG: hypothetical protein M9894_04365 [Planctomycetes bacterium]|nr:hypothetical protein [Planctomycetota bacterium]